MMADQGEHPCRGEEDPDGLSPQGSALNARQLDTIDVILVPESESDENVDEENHEHGSPPCPVATQATPGVTLTPKIILRVDRAAGRASTYTPRRLNPARLRTSRSNDAEAHERGLQANYRRAVRSAADAAITGSCTVWVTLTFDDLNRPPDPVQATKRFLRRLRDRHRRSKGRSLRYVGVVGGNNGEREHVHLLIDQHVDRNMVGDCWPHGTVSSIEEVPVQEIECRVRYMGRHVRDTRLTGHRFLRSRTERGQAIEISVSSQAEAQQVLEDLVHPHRVRVVRNDVSDTYSRITYRFDPLR